MSRILPVLAVVLGFVTPATAAEPTPPNILLILADDLGYGDLGCYGQKQVQTPNLDQLARDGMRFTQFYSGSTVCGPSRCALLTGLHTGHCSVRGNGKTVMPADEVTLGKRLKAAGYTTACFGKWGMGDPGTSGVPSKQGIDEFFGFLNHHHAHAYYPDHLFRHEEKVPLKNELKSPNVPSKEVEYAPDLFTREVLAFLDRKHDKPFFLYYAPTLPHANNERGRAEGNGMEVPDLGIYADKPWPAPQKAHAAMITRLDSDIGKVLARLKEKGLDRNTLVLFTSDNGPHREGGADPAFFQSAGPLTGFKRSMTDGGIRVPFLVRGPGVPAGKVCDQVGAFWDFMPTLCEVAGTKAPAKTDGLSLLPYFRGSTARKERRLYWEFHEGGFKQAARFGPWKGVKLHVEEPLRLYNVENDIGEKTNVAKQHPEVVREIEQFLKDQRTPSEDWPIRPGMRPKN